MDTGNVKEFLLKQIGSNKFILCLFAGTAAVLYVLTIETGTEVKIGTWLHIKPPQAAAPNNSLPVVVENTANST